MRKKRVSPSSSSSRKKLTAAKFSIRDKVEVIGVPPISFSPGVRDEIGTKKLFKSMLWKVYTVKGFDELGNIELVPRRSDKVWIEPEYLKLRTKAKPTKSDSR